LDWIGLGQDFQATLWIGLDWIHELMDWIGLGQQKWTHVQLCVIAVLACRFGRREMCPATLDLRFIAK